MKVLHTSDWHIGKQLHKIDLSEDLEMFFDWLIDTIQKEQIDLLLVSGDIFDQANPSQASFSQYYNFLKRMAKLDCKILLTGGNHDSPAVLNAPKQLLEILDIVMVGGAPDEIQELFFEYKKDDVNLVIAAVPFLKDKDIRKSVAGESYEDKIDQIRIGLKNYFSNVNDYYKANYGSHKFIVMGHLFVQGAQSSDSEREIQIGNQAGVEESIFGDTSDYVALGHIHKPYSVGGSNKIHYSGSPVSFSFSEKEDQKQINIINFTTTQNEVQIIPVPKFRSLIAFEGTLVEVEKMINEFDEKNDLITLGEIRVTEGKISQTTRLNLENLQESHGNVLLQIVKSRLGFIEAEKNVNDFFTEGTDVNDVTPAEMFEKKLEMDEEIENKDELRNAFLEILESLNL